MDISKDHSNSFVLCWLINIKLSSSIIVITDYNIVYISRIYASGEATCIFNWPERDLQNLFLYYSPFH